MSKTKFIIKKKIKKIKIKKIKENVKDKIYYKKKK
jgi:hypothetical protein